MSVWVCVCWKVINHRPCSDRSWFVLPNIVSSYATRWWRFIHFQPPHTHTHISINAFAHNAQIKNAKHTTTHTERVLLIWAMNQIRASLAFIHQKSVRGSHRSRAYRHDIIIWYVWVWLGCVFFHTIFFDRNPTYWLLFLDRFIYSLGGTYAAHCLLMGDRYKLWCGAIIDLLEFVLYVAVSFMCLVYR